MYETLYRFLIKHRKIDLPGIGTVALQMQSAQSEFVSRSFSPPEYFFTLEKNKETPSGKLFSWLASNNNISESEAVSRFNNFVFDLTQQLEAGKEITWGGVGIFQKAHTGEIRLKGDKNELPFLEEVVAKKVIRENAEHTMLVGEVEKTSTQMTEMLSGDMVIKEKHSYWWVWPLGVVIVILIFLGWYFSEHGISSSSTGNNHKISAPSP
jgi:hypothetical protein